MISTPQLKIAIQMDPVENINIHGDSSFMLALEAQSRGYALYHYLPQDLTLRQGRLTAHGRTLGVRHEAGNHYTYGETEILDLESFDLILMRQDPPFDMAYITATHLLEHLSGKTLVLNDPKEVRDAPEKLLVTHFHEFMPETIISRNINDISSFRSEFKDIVLKPLHGNGGAQIFHIAEKDENYNALLEMFSTTYKEPFMIQRYLPAIRQGDKRIILIDGHPAGAMMRIPAQGEARANLHVGGRAEKTTLTRREHEICEALGPELRKRTLVFAGIDVIGDYLTEINVTSPTGIQEINRLDNTALESQLWDAFEQRLSLARKR
ncbi:MAG: glutathione synthase [Alphaproteobacteria bacterium]|nr:glutathione synthase [Alphaproteobacteria bacterium]